MFGTSFKLRRVPDKPQGNYGPVISSAIEPVKGGTSWDDTADPLGVISEMCDIIRESSGYHAAILTLPLDMYAFATLGYRIDRMSRELAVALVYTVPKVSLWAGIKECFNYTKIIED